MAWSAVAPAMAALFAGVTGYCAFASIEEGRRKSLHARMALQGSAGQGVFWWARNGVGPLRPLCRWLLRLRPVADPLREAVRLAGERGVSTNEEALLSSFMAGASAAALVTAFVTGTPVFAMAGIALVVIFFCNRMSASRGARRALLQEQTPEALRALGVCSKSGLSLSQTMEVLSQDLPQPIAGLFEQACLRMKVGEPAQEALAVFSEGESSAELSFVAVALDVRHQTGGSLSQVLESARESVRDELDLRRSLQVQTAQAQLSARIVTCMPFVLVAVFSLVTEDFLAPFFQSAHGVALLVLALAMQVAGVLAVRRLLRREGGRL